MNTKDKVWGAIEFILWVLFAAAILYSVRNPMNIWISALIIVVLGYSAAIACPMIRKSKAFKSIYKGK